MKKKDLNPTEKLMQDLKLVRNYTDYDMIEIEQLDPKFNRIESIQVLDYVVKMDTSDHDNPVVDTISVVGVVAGTLIFVDNPFPNRKPFGTGRVAYILNDKEKNFENALSGEQIGKNLEFLAARYADKLLKVIDPEWEEVVKKRHEAIVKAKSIEKPKHKFDPRYNPKGPGYEVAERIKVEVDQPQNVKDMIAGFEAVLAENAVTIKALMEKLGAKEEQPEKKVVKKEPVKKEPSIKANFAGE
jgi:hypothetical protein